MLILDIKLDNRGSARDIQRRRFGGRDLVAEIWRRSFSSRDFAGENKRCINDRITYMNDIIKIWW